MFKKSGFEIILLKQRECLWLSLNIRVGLAVVH